MNDKRKLFEEKVLFKRIVKWDKDHLELEDGTKITAKKDELYSNVHFSDVKLDAMITNVKWGEMYRKSVVKEAVEITFMHNQNIISKLNADADVAYYNDVISFCIDGEEVCEILNNTI